MTKKLYSWDEFNRDIKRTVKWLQNKNITSIYGIPKGGLIVAVTLANHLPKLKYIHNLANIDENTLIVDDLSDTGDTLLKIPNIGKYTTLTLFCKEKTKYQPTKWFNTIEEDEWLVLPWESEEKEEVRDGTKIE